MITGYRCDVCGASVPVVTPLVSACPASTSADRHHVLRLVDDGVTPEPLDDPNPLVRYGSRLAWWAFARAHGLDDRDCTQLTRSFADDVVTTPFARSDTLSAELGVELWVKDETGNVAGSHKARHLVGILLHLFAAERLGFLPERPPLAIASCGNAALAAATLARRAGWPIDVYVPRWMDDAFGRRLDELDARTHRCDRSPDDPPGDPSMLRFREAVADGALPFTVQGPETALCLDAGRTIGWEIADQAAASGVVLDRAVIQVGGGAFASCVGAGLGPDVRLDTVQAAGCAPLRAAWDRLGPDDPAARWTDVMRAVDDPHSLADGILDDETYDWVAVAGAMRDSGGEPVVATEADIVRAHELATSAGFRVSATGSAGLAGVLAIRHQLGPGDRIAVVMSGVARS